MRSIHKKSDGTIEIKYFYRLKNGKTGFFSKEDAERLAKEVGIETDGREESGRLSRISSGAGRVRDGFSPHWNYSLGKWVDSKTQFNEELKRAGLVNIGKEKPPEKKPHISPIFTDATLKAIRGDAGIPIDDNKLKRLQDLDKADNLGEGINTGDNDSGSGYGDPDPDGVA